MQTVKSTPIVYCKTVIAENMIVTLDNIDKIVHNNVTKTRVSSDPVLLVFFIWHPFDNDGVKVAIFEYEIIWNIIHLDMTYSALRIFLKEIYWLWDVNFIW